MANLSGAERAIYVQEMFTRIAPRYDLMNQLMTFGQDVFWRREVIRRTQLPLNGRLLDLGAGTGDLAQEAKNQYPDCFSLAADFTMEMMRVGRAHPDSSKLDWSSVDALNLPFPDQSYHAIVSGFLLRNVNDIRQALREQYRVLIPGGWMVALDTTRPNQNILSPFINIHLHRVIPRLGQWITGDGEAYRYLPDSTEGFLSAEQLAERMLSAGFREVGFQRMMFGTVAIHWGTK